MALNSNFVINRIGFTPGEAGDGSVRAPGDLDATYTSSRLGLTFVGQDQPFVGPAEIPSPAPVALDNSDNVGSRLGISPESKPADISKPFWPRFRDAVALLACAVKERIMGKLEAPLKAPEPIGASHNFVYPIANPIPEATDNKPKTAYRKGTYKMPSELMVRLKTCATANHKYQYRLVTESLDEFLTSKGFAHANPESDLGDVSV